MRQLIVGAIVGGVLGVMAFTTYSFVFDPDTRRLGFGAFSANRRVRIEYETPVEPGASEPGLLKEIPPTILSTEISLATALLLLKSFFAQGLTGAVVGSAFGVAITVTARHPSIASKS